VAGSPVVPPDTNGDVGPRHYVQAVNVSMAVFDKTGTLLFGPVPGNAVWSGFGGACETTNDGDPIVLYDHLADRWLLSQFTNVDAGPPFFQCLAVSQSGDPTGAYYRYAFQIPNSKLGDYPKLGVWTNAYYMSVNQFACPRLPCPASGPTDYAGVGVAAFERDKMLQGLPAQMLYGDLETVDHTFFGLLPADLDGPPPADDTAHVFVAMESNPDRLHLWEARVDFDHPARSTFGRRGLPTVSLDTAPFDSNLCNGSRNCIPQPETPRRLDAIADRLMFRLPYRDFGTHQTVLVNHTVDVGGGHAGIRWYELRDPGDGSGWAIYQQGTYAPDAAHRWMGSIAMDRDGNIALGYSIAGRTVFPSIAYVGREPGDPLGTLPQGEVALMPGSGVQISANRWGDYSMLTVDPGDDCTFWYTQEYYATTGSLAGIGWQTRIASFRFPSCGPATVTLVVGNKAGAFEVPGCPGVRVGMSTPTVVQSRVADASGSASFSLNMPESASGVTGLGQAVELASCTVSNLIMHVVP
jgi:hypothetical protein